MIADQQPKPTNYPRRVLGVALAFSPLVLLLVSLIVGAVWSQQSNFAAVGFMIAAAVFAIFNFHLSFIRPRLYFFRHGSMDGYRLISGLPIVGTSECRFWPASVADSTPDIGLYVERMDLQSTNRVPHWELFNNFA
jgi:hypothetical protein